MKILWIFFLGHHKIGLYSGVISLHLGYFLKVNVQNGGSFFWSLKFQIFLGVLEIPNIFWVNGRLGPSLRMKKKLEYHLGRLPVLINTRSSQGAHFFAVFVVNVFLKGYPLEAKTAPKN